MVQDSEDLHLLGLWRSGDSRAGSTLVRRYFEPLYRFFSARTQGQVEDLIQQTFMACVESRDAFRGESTFRAYVFGLARFQLYSYYRKSQRGRAQEPMSSSILDGEASPSTTLARREAAQLLSLALQQVPPDQQIALELTYWEGLTAREIAHVLRIPEPTVNSRLLRAKERLRKALDALSDQPVERELAYGLIGDL